MAHANPHRLPEAIPPFHQPSDPRNQDPRRPCVVQDAAPTLHPRADDQSRAIDPFDGPNHPDGENREDVCHPWSDVTGGGGATSVPVAARSQQSQRRHTPGSAERHPWIRAWAQPANSRADSLHATVHHATDHSNVGRQRSPHVGGKGCDSGRSDKPPTSAVVSTGRGSCGEHGLQNASDPH